MPYNDSYIWRIRQKISHDLLVTPCVEVAAVRDGKLLMVYNKDFQGWAMPGGYMEDDGAQWREAAARELREEGGLTVDPKKMRPFAIASGLQLHYKNGDRTQAYSVGFIIDDFLQETEDLDEVEVTEKRWFTISEVKQLTLAPATKMFFAAYEKWLTNGALQIIEIDKDNQIHLDQV